MNESRNESRSALRESRLPGLPPPRRGKVRDVYDLGDRLLLVATDRISAYDRVLTPAIPDKGRVLTQLSTWWFRELADVVRNHLVATDPADFPAEVQPHREQLAGRAVLVHRADVVPFECVARGYLAGSAYREYVAGGSVCGIGLPEGLRRADRLPEPIFTPATKAVEGHDENVTFEHVRGALGPEVAVRLRALTLELYRRAAAHAAACGLILADTKFEFGFRDGHLMLVDEALTPDSSRYWDAATWQPGEEPASFDKQYVRNWLDDSGWDREGGPPELPPEVVEGTRGRYLEAYRRLTGEELGL